jgi:MFS superfamily sulfate permease-like transporter
MQTNNKKGFFSNLKSDLPASIVVFLVAMPLCLGIALASGAPLFSGVIAGIVGGVVVALLSGSPLGVSGPAAGLAVIVLNAIQDLGAFEIFLYAVVVAGVFQLILGFLKAGVIAYYFPSAVIKGMLSGIGIIIILKQIPHAFGYDKDPEGDMDFIQPDGHNTLSELSYMMDAITPGAVVITVVSLALLILWERPFMKKLRFTSIFPGPLAAVIVGVLLNQVFAGMEAFALSGEHMVNIPAADTFMGFWSQFTFPDFSQWNNPQIYVVAATMAVVASLETLLCVEATDKLDPQKRVTPTNRELTAQGIGNIVSGMIGGLPITQVIVRSSANIQSGGQTKASAFFHGVFLLVCAMSIPNLINMIPLSCLAAILFVVGFKLAKPSLFKEMYLKGKDQFIPFVVTIVGIVFTDLLIGIGLGMAVGIFQILWNNYRLPYNFNTEFHQSGEPIHIQLAENVSFLNKAAIQRTLSQLPDETEVIIDATKTRSMHPDVKEIIEDFYQNAETRGIQVSTLGKQPTSTPNPVKQFDFAIDKHHERKAEENDLNSTS